VVVSLEHDLVPLGGEHVVRGAVHEFGTSRGERGGAGAVLAAPLERWPPGHPEVDDLDAAAPVVAAPIAAPPAEPIVGIIAGLQQRKGFLGMSATTFNLIVTPGRLVFASVSQQMMNDAVAAARQEAKGQGKGFLGRFAAQFAWMDQICRQYSTMPIDAILAQFPGSFCILNAQVRKVRLRDSRVDDDGTQSSQELFIESAAGKFRFSSSMMRVREARQILRQTLGRIVK